MDEILAKGTDKEFFQTAMDVGGQYAINVVMALVILIVGWMVAKWISHLVMRAVSRIDGVDTTLEPIIGKIVRYLIMAMVLVMVLGQFGVETASIIAVLATAGLAIGLALQGTLSNVAAGIMILILRPFKVGEHIDAEGINGDVEEIGLFSTIVRTKDGVFTAVPNGQIVSRTITNFSRYPNRRVRLTVGIDYGADVDQAIDVLTKAAVANPKVFTDPEPVGFVSSLDDSSVAITVLIWTEGSNYPGIIGELTRSYKLALDKAGISIPFPQRVIHQAKA